VGGRHARAGQGQAPGPQVQTIRNYLAYLMPVLTTWANQYASLREVTRDDVLDAIASEHGLIAKKRLVAVRSVFRALRRERIVFRDPTQGLSLPSNDRPPELLPDDRVAGLIDRAGGPAARLVVALVAIHAVTAADLAALKMADLDLASCRLTVTWRSRHRVIYLDEVTVTLASQWLRYRHQRWPDSRNPHLLVSQQTAVEAGPVSYSWLRDIFNPLGVHSTRLRQDRILDEARHTADPVHLVRVFGSTDDTAMRYVYTAHPGRQSVIPR